MNAEVRDSPSFISKLLELERIAIRVSLRAMFLPLTVLFRRVDRHLAWRLFDASFGASRPGVFTEITLSELVPDDVVVTVLDLPAENYNVTEAELLVLCSLSSLLAPTLAFEFGTADGRTTRNIARNVAAGGTVLTLNLPLELDRTHSQDVPVGKRFTGTPEAKSIVQLWGDSRRFDFGPYKGSCQLIFIDADHEEEAVHADSLAALEMLDKSRGMIVWHDALRYGVQRALPRLIQTKGIPIHLVRGTNLALTCFVGGAPVPANEFLARSRRMPKNLLEFESDRRNDRSARRR